jgi:uncharacterized BrkB/YihY/UPF0761 family membrane protein
VKNGYAIDAARFRPFVFGLLLILFLAAPLPLFSQSCALCYTQAASSGSKMIHALRNGILILVVPPTLATVCLFFVVHKKRHQTRRPEGNREAGQDW